MTDGPTDHLMKIVTTEQSVRLRVSRRSNRWYCGDVAVVTRRYVGESKRTSYKDIKKTNI